MKKYRVKYTLYNGSEWSSKKIDTIWEWDRSVDELKEHIRELAWQSLDEVSDIDVEELE